MSDVSLLMYGLGRCEDWSSNLSPSLLVEHLKLKHYETLLLFHVTVLP